MGIHSTAQTPEEHPWDAVKFSKVPKLDEFEIREYQVVMRGKKQRKRRTV